MLQEKAPILGQDLKGWMDVGRQVLCSRQLVYLDICLSVYSVPSIILGFWDI